MRHYKYYYYTYVHAWCACAQEDNVRVYIRVRCLTCKTLSPGPIIFHFRPCIFLRAIKNDKYVRGGFSLPVVHGASTVRVGRCPLRTLPGHRTRTVNDNARKAENQRHAVSRRDFRVPRAPGSKVECID